MQLPPDTVPLPRLPTLNRAPQSLSSVSVSIEGDTCRICQAHIFLAGCVGLAVIQGAAARKASKIIAIDMNPDKEKWARDMGATDFVNPKDIPDGKIVEKLVEMTDGGLDYTFDCTGNVIVMRQALEACHKGWGVSTIIGVAAAGKEISTRPFQLVTGRKWQGSAFGGVKGRSELPGIVDDWLNGKLKVDEYVNSTGTLTKINDGFDAMKKGEVIRHVISLENDN